MGRELNYIVMADWGLFLSREYIKNKDFHVGENVADILEVGLSCKGVSTVECKKLENLIRFAIFEPLIWLADIDKRRIVNDFGPRFSKILDTYSM
jgi:hypothetical protein